MLVHIKVTNNSIQAIAAVLSLVVKIDFKHGQVSSGNAL